MNDRVVLERKIPWFLAIPVMHHACHLGEYSLRIKFKTEL